MSQWVRVRFPDNLTSHLFIRGGIPRVGDHVVLPEALASRYSTEISVVTHVIHYAEDHEKIDMQKPDLNLEPVMQHG